MREAKSADVYAGLVAEVLEELQQIAPTVDRGAFAGAAACYAANASNGLMQFPPLTDIELEAVGWPFPRAEWKPRQPRQDLIHAAALLLLELAQLQPET